MESKSALYRAIKAGKLDAPKNPTPETPEHQDREGVKYDAGKARYDLIPPEALDGLARLYALGAKKYDDRNWEKGLAWSRVFSALMRHAWAWFRGEEHDPENGQHHLLSVIWCATALYTFAVRKAGTDDRPHPFTHENRLSFFWRQQPEETWFSSSAHAGEKQ